MLEWRGACLWRSRFWFPSCLMPLYTTFIPLLASVIPSYTSCEYTLRPCTRSPSILLSMNTQESCGLTRESDIERAPQSRTAAKTQRAQCPALLTIHTSLCFSYQTVGGLECSASFPTRLPFSPHRKREAWLRRHGLRRTRPLLPRQRTGANPWFASPLVGFLTVATARASATVGSLARFLGACAAAIGHVSIRATSSGRKAHGGRGPCVRA